VQVAVHFIGGDMVEAESLLLRASSPDQ
jgi:hypothetical protein